MVKNYRKRPVVIQAIQLTRESFEDVIDFIGEKNGEPQISEPNYDECYIGILTLEGVMDAHAGDFIIKGVAGEFYPCKPEIFEKTYEPA